MSKIKNKQWKVIVSLSLVFCIIFGMIATYVPILSVKAAEETGSTVEIYATDLFLSNATATTGTVTLKYTVESATVGGGNTGVVATTDYLSPYPYVDSGSMKYEWNSNQVMTAGRTYTWEIGLGDEGYVTYTGSYTENGSNNSVPINLTTEPINSKSLTNVPCYLGIYMAGSITAKLTNVTCVDEEGNNLGLQINNENCVIDGDETGYVTLSENTTKYKVRLNETSQLFLGNRTELPSGGSIILQYTVEGVNASSSTSYQSGVIGTNWPANDYPHRDGSLDYTNNGNLFEAGFTYTFVIESDKNGGVVYTGRAVDEMGNVRFFRFSDTVVNVPGQRKHYGIWADGTLTADLRNVVCMDTEGNNLGIIVNDNNTSKCDIQEEIPVVKRTVELAGTNLFLSNKAATTKEITLKYTVESATISSGNTGVVATTDYLSPYPYAGNGSMKYQWNSNQVMTAERTYTWEISLSSDGFVTYNGSYKERGNNASVAIELTTEPVNSKNLTNTPAYFGIYIAGETTAKLKNVICVDADGNDLGIQVNSEKSTISGSVPEYVTLTKNATTYTVNLNDTSQLFLGNRTELTTNGPIFLRYTVDSVGNNSSMSYQSGVIGTNWPANDYPHRDGSLDYTNNGNLFEQGFTYTFVIELDSNGEVIYTGRAVNEAGVERNFQFTETVVNVAGQRKHYGIWADGTIKATLKKVVCVDAGGNDLGLIFNDNNTNRCVIETDTTPGGEPEQPPVQPPVELPNIPQGQDVVELNGTNLFLSNKVATTKEVILRYTVESATVEVGNTGVAATTDYLSPYPYSMGSMMYEYNSNQVAIAGCTYTWIMRLRNDGFITYEGYYSVEDSTELVPIQLTSQPINSKELADTPAYFGIYIAGGTIAKLKDAICVDADGNNLGLQVNGENCTVNGSKPEYIALTKDASTYTANLNETSQLFLGNRTELSTNGPIILRYTVDSVGNNSSMSYQSGVIGTNWPANDYPHRDGSLDYTNNGNLFEQGFTYTFVIELDGNGEVIYTGRAVNEAGAERNFQFTETVVNVAGQRKHYGIWADGTIKATLKKVVCVDAGGNDLGLIVNADNTSKCVIQEDNAPVKPPVELPDIPQGKDVVELNGTNLFLSNKVATTKEVILRYTVESSTVLVGNTGIAATTDYLSPYPYSMGSMMYEYNSNQVATAGRTYTWIMRLGNDGFITYEGYYSVEDSTELVPIQLTTSPVNAKSLTNIPSYFGIYIAGATSAKLKNVICVDASGKELGIQVNHEKSTVNGVKPQHTTIGADVQTYTVSLNGTTSLFLGNYLEAPSNGPVILQYTVDSVGKDNTTSYQRGVIASAYPYIQHPYKTYHGSMAYTDNGDMFEPGFTYTFIIGENSDREVVYTGRAVNEAGEERTFSFAYTAGGEENSVSPYFGIWADGNVVATLKNVVCVDSEGNDLGLRVNDEHNADNYTITADASKIGSTEQPNESFKKMTFSHFYINDGEYSYNTSTDFNVSGDSIQSMDKTVICGDLYLRKGGMYYICIGGQYNPWYGLRFTVSEDGAWHLSWVGEGTEEKICSFNRVHAKTDLVGKWMNFMMSTEIIDADKDGVKDDIRLGIWFNNVLYQNKYITILNHAPELGSSFSVYCLTGASSVSLRSIPELVEEFDFASFGLTKNWKKTLLETGMKARHLPMGGSKDGTPYTGDTTDIAMPVIVAGISALGILICLYAMLKRKRNI